MNSKDDEIHQKVNNKERKKERKRMKKLIKYFTVLKNICTAS